jgi:signal recognition particle receptor subunit beta
MSQRHDYLVKIVLIGDSGVGKSSFVLKYCDNSFKTNVMSTIGVDFKIKRLTIDGKVVKLQIVSFTVYLVRVCLDVTLYLYSCYSGTRLARRNTAR